MDWNTNIWDWGAYLLHQQCWHWGQDIRRPQGNLLLAYGFNRTRTPDGVEGSTRYALREGPLEWFLWGFGMALSEASQGAIYVNRYHFSPLWLDSGDRLHQVWNASLLADLRPAACGGAVRRTQHLLKLLLQRVASYERWVLEREGVGYRRLTLSDWHRPAVLPERMPQEWERLIVQVEESPIRRSSPSALDSVKGQESSRSPNRSAAPRVDEQAAVALRQSLKPRGGA